MQSRVRQLATLARTRSTTARTAKALGRPSESVICDTGTPCRCAVRSHRWRMRLAGHARSDSKVEAELLLSSGVNHERAALHSVMSRMGQAPYRRTAPTLSPRSRPSLPPTDQERGELTSAPPADAGGGRPAPRRRPRAEGWQRARGHTAGCKPAARPRQRRGRPGPSRHPALCQL